MKCLVTGASGFIGAALSRELDARGYSLQLIAHRVGDSPVAGVALHSVNLGTEAFPTALLAGVQQVFHCAGIAHQQASSEDYERVNHQATLDLAQQAAAAGVVNFLFLSSVKADASAATPYGLWKWRTEQALRQLSQESSMAVQCVRPALVYGPGVRGNLRQLITGARKHMPTPPPGGARSMIGLDDLVTVLQALAQRSPQGFRVFTATDGQHYSTRRVYQAITQGLGRKPAGTWLPTSVWRLACYSLDLLAVQAPGITWEKMFGEQLYSNAALCQALDWQPSVQFEQVVPAMLEGLG